jgi:hypothetical protein
MAAIWEKVQRLEGATLHTLAQGRPFKIVEVTTDVVRLVPEEGKRKRREVRRDRIEYIAGLGVDRDKLRKRVLEEYPTSQNTSYYAAIVYEIGQP